MLPPASALMVAKWLLKFQASQLAEEERAMPKILP